MAFKTLKAVSLLLFCTSCTDVPTAYQWPLPADFPKPAVPADNPMSAAKVELGRFLFYDNRLSANQQQSCSSCHQQQYAFAEPRPVSIGSTGQQHRRNALALVNIAYNKTLTWAHDGLTEIEQQQLIPMFGDNPVELGIAGHETEILARLNHAPYPTLFEAAFGEPEPNFQHINQALASFVRRLISLQSPFDRYAYQNDDKALSPEQLQGMELFFSERLECHHCHGGFNFTQSTSHEKQPLDRRPFFNTGLYFAKRQQFSGLGYPDKDRGLAEISQNAADDGRFRAPTLRNISLTAPYMHDGSIATLPQVLEFYLAGGRHISSGPDAGDGRLHPYKSPFIKNIDLTAAEKAAVLAFLQSLTDPVFISDPALADPWQAKTTGH
ncbi:MbnH family di-heme enzyme [Rheinheimera sp.]|uniref:MbnH family di-heme enzyme n=1 Tax=Rheinheimera sp. TaxID=1869214 RepID=UPI0027B9AC34|nr:MbnH family di-heme enzyme [Rheinheimera sp.]